MTAIKFFRLFLLALIVVGVGLLGTQKTWVPTVVAAIIAEEQNPMPAIDSEHVTGAFYSAYIRSLASSTPLYNQPAFATQNFISTQRKLQLNGNLRGDPLLCSEDTPPKIHLTLGQEVATSSVVSGYWTQKMQGKEEGADLHVSLLRQKGKWLIDSISCSIR
jgi:hypothetical protein